MRIGCCYVRVSSVGAMSAADKINLNALNNPMKINTRQGGFTLVEIMIVVAIIALLASIAVPNFMRARTRSQASLVKDDLRVLDSAIDQYAIEKNKKKGDGVAIADLQPYLKNSTALYSGNDVFGKAYGLTTVGELPTINTETKAAFTDVTDTDFWSPFAK